MSNPVVGFVGLGAMGQGQARSLIRAGFEVRGFDIDSRALAAFVEAGGVAVSSPADAAKGAALLFVLVFDAEQVESVLYGSEGAVATLPKGATVVLHTTGTPEYAENLGGRLANTGHRLLDAPVTGGKARADAGTLTAIVSGTPGTLEAARVALEAMASTVVVVGEKPGEASVVKMASQLLVGVHTAAMGEALTLAAHAGANLEKLLEVVKSGVGNSFVFENFARSVIERDFETKGAVEILVKDLGIVSETARTLGLSLPVATAASSEYRAVATAGCGRENFTAVIKAVETAGRSDEAKDERTYPG